MVIQPWAELLKDAKTLGPGLSEKFLLLSTLSMMIQLFLGKRPLLVQNCYFVQKTTNRQSWKFSKAKFWRKRRMQNSVKTKPLSFELLTNWLALYFHHDWKNALALQKMSKNSSVKETGPSYGQKFACSDNPWQNILQKAKKYNQIGPELKNVIFNFACFLTAIVNV